MELDETNEAHRSQSQADGECSALPTLDELSLVGYPEEVDGNDIFEKSGLLQVLPLAVDYSI